MKKNPRRSDEAVSELSQAGFKCPCEGENGDCVHCHGSGHTRQPVELRSRRTLSLDNLPSEPFRTKREKLMGLQVMNRLRHLRMRFLVEPDNRPTLFIDFLRQLTSELYCSQLRGIYLNFYMFRDLKMLAQTLQSLHMPNEKVRILAEATDATIVIYTNALAEKRKAATDRRQAMPVALAAKTQGWIQCPHCHRKTYDLGQHNALFHPGVRLPTPRANGLVPRSMMKSPGKSANVAANGKNNRSGNDSMERSMDARRTWGGRFRDFNGTFGSYPLHDSMDDESGAN